MKISFIYRCFLALAISLYFNTSISAQETKVFQNLLGNLAIYTNNYAPEKVYVQTDKDFYTNGDTIWLSAYILDGVTHVISDKSWVVYIELIGSDGGLVVQEKLFTGNTGAAGDIQIPETLEEGTYVLRAYTKYMLNDENPVLFEKEIPVWALQANGTDTDKNKLKSKKQGTSSLNELTTAPNQPDLNVQFFPEGGDLVSGLENVMGVKVTDNEGKGIAIEGKVLDQENNPVAFFKSHELGLGRFILKVKPDSRYFLELENNKEITRHPLPEAELMGYNLHLTNMGEQLKISVCSNIRGGLKGALLLGHLRGRPILKQFLTNSEEACHSIKLLTSELPDGVAHFTLFTPNGEPVSERLTFIENPENSAKLSLSTNKPAYTIRDKVNIDLELVDATGKPLSGDFSMSVASQNSVREGTGDMRGWLLLNSDLGATVPDVNYFFQEDVKNRKQLLDLLMLTHGWRRFSWEPFTSGEVRKEFAFAPEKGIMIQGKTTKFDTPFQPLKTMVSLNVLADEIAHEKQPTNSKGQFSFGPFFYQDSVPVVLNSSSLTAQNEEETSIYLDAPFPSIPPIRNIQKQRIFKTTLATPGPYLQEALRKKTNDFKYDPKVIQLDEAFITSKSKTRQDAIKAKMNSRTMYGDSRNRIIADSIPGLQMATNTAVDMLRMVPGVQIFGNIPNQTVRVRASVNFKGPIAPLYVIDGIPIAPDNFGTPEEQIGVPDVIQYLPVSDILFVDVLTGPEAAIYGTRAMGGVIAYYTKRGDLLYEKPNSFPGVMKTTVKGFRKTREFYKPNYATPKPGHQIPDYRTTLHWDPYISIKEGTTSKLNFYTGDTIGNYLITIEGITDDGRPVSQMAGLKVVGDSP